MEFTLACHLTVLDAKRRVDINWVAVDGSANGIWGCCSADWDVTGGGLRNENGRSKNIAGKKSDEGDDRDDAHVG